MKQLILQHVGVAMMLATPTKTSNVRFDAATLLAAAFGEFAKAGDAHRDLLKLPGVTQRAPQSRRAACRPLSRAPVLRLVRCGSAAPHGGCLRPSRGI